MNDFYKCAVEPEKKWNNCTNAELIEMFKNVTVTDEMVQSAISRGESIDLINRLIYEKNCRKVKLECGNWVDIGNSKQISRVLVRGTEARLWISKKGNFIFGYEIMTADLMYSHSYRVAIEDDLKLFPKEVVKNKTGIDEFPENQEK